MALALLLALALATTPAPSAHARLAAYEARVAGIAERLARAAPVECPAPRPDAGWLLQDLRLVPPALQPAARRAYGIAPDAPAGPYVAALAPGSAAAAAGVAVGDPVPGAAGGAATLAAAEAAPLDFPAPLRCAPVWRVEASDRLAASATRTHVHLHAGLIALTLPADHGGEAALAFVMAHEWAHQRLSHPLPGEPGAGRGLRAREAAADTLAVTMTDAAGYDARGAVRLFQALARADRRLLAGPQGSDAARAARVLGAVQALCQRAGTLSGSRPSCS